METEFATMQETFDALVGVPAATEVLYADFESVVNKHLDDMRTVGKTDSFFDDVSVLAEKFGVEFSHPKFKKGLTTVKTQPTVH